MVVSAAKILLFAPSAAENSRKRKLTISESGFNEVPRSQMCNDENGNSMTIEEALQRRNRTGRFLGSCTECGGRVRAHKEGKYRNIVMAAHFEHIEEDKRCSLSRAFRG
jgi:hypothetical protein